MVHEANLLEGAVVQYATVNDLYPSQMADGRFALTLDTGRFECLYCGKPDAKRLFVLLSGAIDPQKEVWPRFNRWSWHQKFPGAVLNIADPTIALASQDIRIGWYLGTTKYDWTCSMATLVQTFSAGLGIPTSNVIAYGSSAGGFAAMRLAAALGDATAVAINPQTNIFKYYPAYVETLLHTAFGGMDVSSLSSRIASRFLAAEALRVAPQARCLLVQNTVDRHHFIYHYTPLCDELQIPLKGGQAENGRYASVLYSSPQGHGAEPKEIVDSLIRASVALSGDTPVNWQDLDFIQEKKKPIFTSQLYLLDGKAAANSADEIIFQAPGRSDLPPHPIQLPFNWGDDPYSDRNWCAQLHMWRMIDAYLLKYEKTGSNAWLRIPVRIVQDWYRHVVKEKKAGEFAWMDMMVGLRGMKLAYLLALSKSGTATFGPYFLRICQEMVSLHIDFIVSTQNIAYSNHTLIDLHGAMALAQVADAQDKARVNAYVDAVLPKLLAEQFGSTGLHRENSPAYHRYAIDCLSRLEKSGWFKNYGIDELLQKARALENWLMLPDGRFAPIGDTDGAPYARQGVPVKYLEEERVLNDSGYVVIRQSRGETSLDASYLFFMGAFNSRFHKQSDDLSFIWFEGEDILCDSGKYAYKKSKNRGYALSTRAHNTVEIDNVNSGDKLSLKPELCYGSAVNTVTEQAGGYVIEANVEQKKFPILHSRFVYYRPNQCVLVIDLLRGEAKHSFTQWFHFAPHLDVTADAKNGYVSLLASGRHLRIFSIANCPLSSSLVRGQTTPQLQGWISQRYAQIEPNHALGVYAQGRVVRMATLFSLDDTGSTLSMHRDGQISLELRIKNDLNCISFLHDNTKYYMAH